ncbi:hypothetical protein AUJ61_01825 [Candidatus Pacearchaeota archaeon CG1_02_30_18]|nr:MAG: hypothetical protein QJ16_C0005G0035 [archaeon GW2011_AR1]MBS3078074.1 metal-dependent hydrolase [Candidatus Pacearchaeota archaeon]OIO40559.1 MAG: hypothetical protein AUJ61_01825 [Candidatus Pacearchaeota archaeon CG1_02_30_18]PIN71553.1 MAG: hypothetical protein COV77_01485 [Candidatus Pacearchaeota archaeon CG11_big_fil_rev_8_21_14_0_20_30_13]PIZ81751.1 MAG: hypothetical protein COX98_02730 [Candidatus Pacearchaeota archaeon CG_4_10_14_0_2_um_filter_30_11]PJA71632.1 MAG: hypothetic
MLFKTHVIISLFGGLLLMSYFNNSFLFLGMVLISTLIPDLDSFNSKIGKRFSSRVLTSFTKHRGIMHSLLFLIIIYLLLYFYFQILSFGFLIGYSVHLFCDLITKQGLRLFYPLKFKISGFIKTGGKMEGFLFLIFGIADLFLLIMKVTYFCFFFN